MLKYILIRFFQSIVILFALSFIIYGMISLMPGDRLATMMAKSPTMTPDDVARLKKRYGLDKSFVVQYKIWLVDALQGDLGESETYHRPVPTILFEKVSNTFKLTGMAFLFSLLVAIPLGIICSLTQYSKLDYSLSFLSFVGISIPTFWFGILVIWLFANKLGILPPGGIQTPEVESVVDKLHHLIMPVMVLSIVQIGSLLRFTRSSMLEINRSDYIRTARAKGLDTETVVLKHAFRNALIPIVTIITLSIPGLFGGTIIIEKVFGYPGMGGLLFDAVTEKDRNIVLVAFLALSSATLFFNFIADIIYAYADPRIRVQ